MTKLYEKLSVGGVEYDLKISTANAVQLETELKTDILSGLDNILQINVLAQYYFAALKGQNDSINTINDVYTLFDDAILEGRTYDELQQLIVKVLVVSGIMTQEAYDTSKKAMEKQREALQKLLN